MVFVYQYNGFFIAKGSKIKDGGEFSKPHGLFKPLRSFFQG